MKGVALIPLQVAGERLHLDLTEIEALTECGLLKARDVGGDHVSICEASVAAFTALVLAGGAL